MKSDILLLFLIFSLCTASQNDSDLFFIEMITENVIDQHPTNIVADRKMNGNKIESTTNKSIDEYQILESTIQKFIEDLEQIDLFNETGMSEGDTDIKIIIQKGPEISINEVTSPTAEHDLDYDLELNDELNDEINYDDEDEENTLESIERESKIMYDQQKPRKMTNSSDIPNSKMSLVPDSTNSINSTATSNATANCIKIVHTLVVFIFAMILSS